MIFSPTARVLLQQFAFRLPCLSRAARPNASAQALLNYSYSRGDLPAVTGYIWTMFRITFAS